MREKNNSPDFRDILSEAWTKPVSEVLEYYSSNGDEGLSESEVKERRQEFGLNKLKEAEKTSKWKLLANQFKSLLVILLSIAAVISFIFGKWLEGIAISVVLIINSIIGFVTEIRAVRSMESLRELTKIDAKVLRNGEVNKIIAEKLVPGDIVVLESGDIVPADLRLIEASKLQADESALTGESVPVSKEVASMEGDVELADRKNMLYKGTFVTRGSAKGIVVSTGMDTELGQISLFIDEAEEEETPLEKRLDKLSRRLIPVLLAIAGIVGVAGILRGMELFLMIETAIALAVATVPEGLPIVATLALARGMWRMAEQNALINRLSSVETLGSTSIIFTDKTGTLTENRMTVNKYSLDSGEIEVSGSGLDKEGDFHSDGKSVNPKEELTLKKTLEVGVLCNNASYREENGEKNIVGDPMEVSLLIAGLKAGIKRSELTKSMPEVKEVSFDPSVKMMATFHELNEEFRVAVKGAPEAVINSSSHLTRKNEKKKFTKKEKEKWQEKNEELAKNGFRVLALAEKTVKSSEANPYEDLNFLGLVAMIDPPKKEVKEAIKTCQKAGIRIIMVTGDHAETARNIAHSVGLIESQDVDVVSGSELKNPEESSKEEKERFLNAPIFARVNPKQKLDLIELHQEDGSIVAMTGDGVNDAPALKKANIGIAMGERGTQVAKEAAHMILQDDNFSTITKAVEQGRVIFRNIRKFVFYLLSCNISELLVILLASLMGVPLPILPLQILFLNVVTDIFPAFALGVGEGSQKIMEKKPRNPKEPVLTKRHWLGISTYGILISIGVLIAFIISSLQFGMFINGEPNHKVVTISFLTIAFAQLWHVFNMRDKGSNFLKNEITQNKYIWLALALCSGLLILATYAPGLSNVLQTLDPGIEGWLIILPMSLFPWFIGQTWNSLNTKRIID
ncbi:MAG: cation-transporting P-type ATPase [Hadesarchaea archaeon]|nr:cation-transporting P-type ATPase [Hadesarchaea archaeon]